MTRCPECGWEIDPDDEMCPNCGTYLADYEDIEPSGESGTYPLEAAARAPKEFPEATGRRRDLPSNNFPGRRVEHDCVRSAPILVGREPNWCVEELGVLDHQVRARILDDVDEVLQQLPLVAVDLLPREAFRLVLIDLRIQEPGIAHHAARIERDLEPER